MTYIISLRVPHRGGQRTGVMLVLYVMKQSSQDHSMAPYPLTSAIKGRPQFFEPKQVQHDRICHVYWAVSPDPIGTNSVTGFFF